MIMNMTLEYIEKHFMSEQSWQMLHSKFLCKMGQDFLDIQKETRIWRLS